MPNNIQAMITESEKAMMDMRCIIIDVDGTLADTSKRVKYVKNKPKDWKKFFAAQKNDRPHGYAVRLAQIYSQHGFVIHIVSARPEDYRKVTEGWLQKHGVPYDFLWMRPLGDYRPDTVIKKEILDTKLPKKKNIEFVLDDSPKVVEMWREEGLTCLHCNHLYDE